MKAGKRHYIKIVDARKADPGKTITLIIQNLPKFISVLIKNSLDTLSLEYRLF